MRGDAPAGAIHIGDNIGAKDTDAIGGTIVAIHIDRVAHSRITRATAKDMAIIGGMAAAIVTPDNVKTLPHNPNVSQMDVFGLMLPVTERLQNVRI